MLILRLAKCLPRKFLLHTTCFKTVFFSDVNKISEAIADKFSVFVQRLTTFVGGFVVGFINSWELTLVIMAISPLLGVGAALMGRVSS